MHGLNASIEQIFSSFIVSCLDWMAFSYAIPIQELHALLNIVLIYFIFYSFTVTDHHGERASGCSAKMDVDPEAGQASDRDGSPSASDEMDSDQANGGSQYNERRALRMAVMDWLPELYKTKTSSGQMRARLSKIQPAGQTSNTEEVNRPSDDDTKKMSVGSQSMSQTDVSTCGTDYVSVSKTVVGTSNTGAASSQADVSSDGTSNVPLSRTNVGMDGVLVAKSRRDEDHCDLLTVDDVLLICHLFYLPYEHGPRANLLLQTACWLLGHIPSAVSTLDSVSNCNSSSSDEGEEMAYEWYHRAGQFHRLNREIAIVVDKLVNIPNREMLYEIYAYITDIRSTLALVNSYIKWHGMLYIIMFVGLPVVHCFVCLVFNINTIRRWSL